MGLCRCVKSMGEGQLQFLRGQCTTKSTSSDVCTFVPLQIHLFSCLSLFALKDLTDIINKHASKRKPFQSRVNDWRKPKIHRNFLLNGNNHNFSNKKVTKPRIYCQGSQMCWRILVRKQIKLGLYNQNCVRVEAGLEVAQR